VLPTAQGGINAPKVCDRLVSAHHAFDPRTRGVKSCNYCTGTEFHVEGAISKSLGKDFSIGPAGYFYDQISGGSGAGDKLGPFEGHVAGLGGAIGYNFIVGKTPVSASIKVYREFNVQNRLEGTCRLVHTDDSALSVALV